MIKVILRSILRLVKFDRLSENAGASQLLSKAALPFRYRDVEPVRLLGHMARASFCWGVACWESWACRSKTARFFLFLPRPVHGGADLVFRDAGSRLFSRAALLAAVNANVPSPRILSLAVRSIIMVFVLSVVFEELGLAEQTMLVAFGIAFGALMLGLAIAFGIGGRDLARRFLEEKFVRSKKEKDEDELSPL